MLLNNPTTKNYSALNVYSAKVENPWVEHFVSSLSLNFQHSFLSILSLMILILFQSEKIKAVKRDLLAQTLTGILAYLHMSMPSFLLCWIPISGPTEGWSLCMSTLQSGTEFQALEGWHSMFAKTTLLLSPTTLKGSPQIRGASLWVTFWLYKMMVTIGLPVND